MASRKVAPKASIDVEDIELADAGAAAAEVEETTANAAATLPAGKRTQNLTSPYRVQTDLARAYLTTRAIKANIDDCSQFVCL